MKVLNDLLEYKNLKIYQNTDWFLFSLDSILLPNFVTLNSTTRNIIDFCTGNAPIPLVLSTKTNANIVGVEIQKDVYKLAVENIKLNGLEKKIKIVNFDVKKINELYSPDSFDLVICNPPYFKFKEKSHVNLDMHKVIARHEVLIELHDIIKSAKYLLKNNGRLAMVHRTERLFEIYNLLDKNNFKIKKIQFVYPKIGLNSNLVLIEARKNGNDGIKLLAPLFVHNEDGSYTQEILKMFK